MSESTSDNLGMRPMEDCDLAAALRLSTAAGWNQTVADWQLFLRSSPAGCFVAAQDGNVVGTVATIRYGAVAWIGMMLVDAAFQRRGIGRALMQRALEHLAATPRIQLDATPAGQPLYEKLGFVVEDELGRWIYESPPQRPDSPESATQRAQLIKSKTVKAVVEFDQRVFGARRAGVLDALHKAAPLSAWQYAQEDSLRAFSLGRPGCRFHQIGPVAATSLNAAKLVTEAALQSLKGRAIVLDVPLAQTEYAAWLQGRGFIRQRLLRRMVKNGVPRRCSAQQYAIAGPELG